MLRARITGFDTPSRRKMRTGKELFRTGVFEGAGTGRGTGKKKESDPNQPYTNEVRPTGGTRTWRRMDFLFIFVLLMQSGEV